MMSLHEARLQILIFSLFLRYLETLLRVPLQVGGSISIHNMHVVNNTHPLMPEVPYEKFYFIL